MQTRWVNISTAKASHSAEYCESWIGKKAIYRTHEGEELVGTISRWMQFFPVVTFADGSWGRLDQRFQVID